MCWLIGIKWLKQLFLQTEILHKDISLFNEEIDAFAVTLKAAQEQYNVILNEAIEGIKSELEAQHVKKKSINGTKPINGVETKQVKRALRSILTTQDEVWGILRENTRLM